MLSLDIPEAYFLQKKKKENNNYFTILIILYLTAPKIFVFCLQEETHQVLVEKLKSKSNKDTVGKQ